MTSHIATVSPLLFKKASQVEYANSTGPWQSGIEVKTQQIPNRSVLLKRENMLTFIHEREKLQIYFS